MEMRGIQIAEKSIEQKPHPAPIFEYPKIKEKVAGSLNTIYIIYVLLTGFYQILQPYVLVQKDQLSTSCTNSSFNAHRTLKG